MGARHQSQTIHNINLTNTNPKPRPNEPVELIWNEEKQWYEAAPKRSKAVSP